MILRRIRRTADDTGFFACCVVGIESSGVDAGSGGDLKGQKQLCMAGIKGGVGVDGKLGDLTNERIIDVMISLLSVDADVADAVAQKFKASLRCVNGDGSDAAQFGKKCMIKVLWAVGSGSSGGFLRAAKGR